MKLSIDEIIRLNRNMYMYLNSGYNVLEVMDMMVRRKLVRGKTMKAIKNIKQRMNHGETMSNAFQKAQCFPTYMVQFITVGEESGQLCNVYKSLADYYEEKKNRKKSITSAVAYPIFVLILAIALLLAIVLYFAPMMNSNLGSCNIRSNEYMVVLLNINNWLRKNWVIILVTLVFVIIANLFCFCGHKRCAYIILNKFVIIRAVYHSICSMKFTYFMYVLLNDGVHINKCLEILMNNEQDYIIRQKLSQGIEEIKNGEPLYKALYNMDVFPDTTIDMISVGEDTAQLESSLYTSYNIQKNSFQDNFKKFLNILQPTLIIILGIMIFLLIYSVMSPVVESMGNIK